METLKLLLPPDLQAEDSGFFMVYMAMIYVYFKYFIPHAAEIAENNATSFNRSICEKNKEWAMTCKKLAGPGLILFAGALHILFYALSAIRTIIDLLSR